MIRDFAPDDAQFYLGDPYPVLRRLRWEDPVHWYEKSACWCVTKHADVEHVSRNPELFTSTKGFMLGAPPENRPPGVPPPILEMDPPEHNRHRKLVMQAFMPRAIAALEPRVRAIARDSLDAVPVGEPVEELLTRLPEFEPAGPFERLRSVPINGFERMPVVFRA